MMPKSFGCRSWRLAYAFVPVLQATASLAGHELEGRDTEAGYELYQEHCASCHGANLEGHSNWLRQNADGTFPAPPHDKTGHTWHHDNQLLFTYTSKGGRAALAASGIPDFNSGMPAFGDVMSDDEIWDVLAYMRSTWPEQLQESQAEQNLPHD